MERKLEKEFNFYLEHQEEFVKKYFDKYLVIRDSEIVGIYENEIEAYTESSKKYNLGTFLIQHCLPGENNYKQTFHSRVIFA